MSEGYPSIEEWRKSYRPRTDKMNHITEIIPDDIPQWMQDAIDDGQFFRICRERVEELEADAARYRYLKGHYRYSGREQHRLEWYLPRWSNEMRLENKLDESIDEAIGYHQSIEEKHTGEEQ